MRRMMLSYAHVFTTQIAQTALANGRAKIEARVARSLLMVADRIGGLEMPLTHELLAVMLGVRRPGVTDAIHLLEGEHAIRARRGAITIQDRDRLEALAGGTYGISEREHHRVLGTPAGGAATGAFEIPIQSAVTAPSAAVRPSSVIVRTRRRR